MATRRALLEKIRDPGLRRILRLARAEARGLRGDVYLVGGCVRDLVLGVALRDVDLVVVGDAGAFARGLAARLGGRSSSPTRFGTCRIVVPGFPPIDIATARRETYANPAALPEVEPAPIEADLARRDFTINSMAIALTGPGAGEFLDPTGGLADLGRKRLRLLHARSLVDDPTRAFRGARYAARFRLRPDAPMRRALASPEARRSLSSMGRERLSREIGLVWKERDPDTVFSQLAEWGLLSALHPRIEWHGRLSRWLKRGQRTRSRSGGGGSPDLMLSLVAASLNVRSRFRFFERLGVRGRARQAILAAAAAPERASRLGRTYRDAAAVAGWSETALLTAVIAGPRGSAARLRALRRAWQAATPRLKAADLLAAGVPQGPRIARILEGLRRARFERRVRTRREEMLRLKRRS